MLWFVRSDAPWRYIPGKMPPWPVVYQRTQRWLKASVFEAIVHDLRELLRVTAGRKGQPSAVILDARTMQSTVEIGERADYDGHKQMTG